MTVNFTTNIGLAQPDTTEIARLWEDTDKLEEDNKKAINTYIGDIDPVIYTPTFAQSGTGHTVTGFSKIEGWYVTLPGKLVMGGFVIICNSSISPGTVSGDYLFGLPSSIDTAFYQQSGFGEVIGQGFVRDQSSFSNSMTVSCGMFTTSNSLFRLLMERGLNRVFGYNDPFILGVDDSISASFCYVSV